MRVATERAPFLLIVEGRIKYGGYSIMFYVERDMIINGGKLCVRSFLCVIYHAAIAYKQRPGWKKRNGGTCGVRRSCQPLRLILSGNEDD